MWLIIAFVLILFLSIMLVRYHLTIRSLTSQIRAKRRTGSQVRLTLRDQSPSLVALIDEVEQLFQEIDKMSFVTQQEKMLIRTRWTSSCKRLRIIWVWYPGAWRL